MFNKTFYHFFFGFVAIISVAFVVLIVTGMQPVPDPIDNLALPK
jgi:hypothetical protein